MDLLSYLRTLKRHWVLILALCVAGAALGAASSQLHGTTAKGRTYYKATTTLIVDLNQRNGQVSPAFTSLDQLAIYTTTGEVPDDVAKKLADGSNGRVLAEHITTLTNSATGTIAITDVDPDAETARRVADTFASELSSVLDQRAIDNYGKARDQLLDKLNGLQATENSLLAQLGQPQSPANFDNLKAQYQAAVNQYTITYQSYAELANAGPPTTRFSVLQKAESIPIGQNEYDSRLSLGASGQNNLTSDAAANGSAVDASSSSSTLDGPVARGVLGGVLGLLLGIGLAFLREVFDRRIRTRAEAETAYGLPVLAEVPLVTRDQAKRRVVVSAVAPLSRVAEAHRAVRSSLLFSRAAMGAPVAPSSRDDQLFEPAHGEPFVVMITSATPAEGKTSTTANLAAVFAEAGASVLAVNCDFRRPALHAFFGVPDEPRRVHETNVPGVKIVTNVLSDPAANPSQVIAAQRQVVAAARGRFDVILLDTAPLLTANDAVEIIGSADLVLLVARLGSTRTDNAEQVMQLLGRLDVPLAGVVLIGSESAANDYYYYYQPGRVDGADAHAAGRDARRAPTTPSTPVAAGLGNGAAANGNSNGAAASAELFGEPGQGAG